MRTQNLNKDKQTKTKTSSLAAFRTIWPDNR